MRQLARHKDQNYLIRFSEFLFAEDIESEVEKGSDDHWELWIRDDDHLESSKEFWEEYQENPDDSRYSDGASKGRKKFDQEKKAAKKVKAKIIDGRTASAQASSSFFPAMTIGPVVLSIGIFGAGMFNPELSESFFRLFAISISREGFLTEVLSGQVWRLLTPVFLHGGLLHLIFNMYWMVMLGPLIERCIGWKKFLTLFIFSGILSNLLQYFIVGPNFVGMSGIVYALIGFAWLAQKRRPILNLGMTDGLWIFSLIWMGLGFLNDYVPIFGGIGIANYGHLGGLLSGLLMVFLLEKTGHLPQQNT